jgi:DNA-directed RNA polymerase specialized sigma24 family protein
MKIPEGMEENEVLIIIEKVTNRIAPKYVTYGYTIDDMKQEAFLMCVEALPRYDRERPLENFLSVHVSNRMKNFLRDNVKINDEEKHKIIRPSQLSQDIEKMDDDDVHQRLDYKDMVSIVDVNIPASMRIDYLKMAHDFYVPKQRREEIGEFIKNLLKEHGYEKG